MRLTEAGDEFLNRIAGPVRQIELAIHEVSSPERSTSGVVTIGMLPSLSHLISARLARRVAQELSDVSLRIIDGYPGHMIEWLQSGEIDIAFLYGPSSDLHLRVIDLVFEEMRLIGPPDSSLMAMKSVAVKDLEGTDFILPFRPHGLRPIMESAFAKANIRVRVRAEADTQLVIKDLVASGIGFSMLPLSSIKPEDAGRLSHTSLSPKIMRQILLALPSDRRDTRAVQAVTDLIQEEIRIAIESGAWPAVPSPNLTTKKS
jgi:LysR family nitrogen assimilation transcriptional regulator